MIEEFNRQRLPDFSECRYEYRYKHADGRWIWIECRGSCAQRIDGRAVRKGAAGAVLRHVADLGGVVPAEVLPGAIGADFLRLVAAAEAAGLDPEQEARDALRQLEARVQAAEAARP